MAEKFDAVILGMGPGGENVAGRLLKAGKKVAVIERELVGGECAYWACIPSKTLLRPPELKGEATRAFGTGTPEIDVEDLFNYRDYIIRNLNDSSQVESYEGMGARVIKGEGRLAGQGRVEVNGETLETDHVVIATGSSQNMLPIEGIEDVTVWTNREATTTREVPGRAVIVGGGANGVETSQWLSRLGCSVTIVQSPDKLVNREDPQVGEILKGVLEDEGIGLESVGVEVNKKGLAIDDHCRVEGTQGLWAVGDVTGVLLFTHVAQYQGRIVATNILGGERVTDYNGIPRVVFSDPEVAATGLTEEQARQEGIDVASINLEMASSLARPVTYEREPRGNLGLVVDRDQRTLIGAWAVAPQAGEWIHQACLAVKTRTSVDILLDSIFQFPTFSQGYLEALEKMDL